MPKINKQLSYGKKKHSNLFKKKSRKQLKNFSNESSSEKNIKSAKDTINNSEIGISEKNTTVNENKSAKLVIDTETLSNIKRKSAYPLSYNKKVKKKQ
jgi:hypothetical protein